MHGSKQPLNHSQFIRHVAIAWIKPLVYWSSNNSRKRGHSSISRSTTITAASTECVSIITRISTVFLPKQNATLSDKSLAPYTGAFRWRLDHAFNNLLVYNDKPEASCKMHYWLSKAKYWAQIMKGLACNVTLCLSCYKSFHKIPNLVKMK